MSVIPFINKTPKTKFEGFFQYDQTEYKYTFYLVPIVRKLPKTEEREIINYFGNRLRKGKICLDVDETTVRYYLDNDLVSAFVMVKPRNVNNIASGTIQIINRCHISAPSPDNIEYADIWVNDICRISQTGKEGGEPLKALFFLIEQLAIQNLGKSNIKLYIDRDPSNVSFLKPTYEQIGFHLNVDDNPSMCPEWSEPEMAMEKPNLTPHPEVIDLSFLKVPRYEFRSYKKQRTYGGKKKTRRKRRKRSLRRKMRK